MIVVSKSLPPEVDDSANNSTTESHFSVEAKEKLGTMDSKCVSLFIVNHLINIQCKIICLNVALASACYATVRSNCLFACLFVCFFGFINFFY